MSQSHIKKGIFFWVPAFLCAYFWICGVGILTDLTSSFGITFFTAGLLIIIPAILLPYGKAFIIVLLSGFLFDAMFPVSLSFGGTMSFFDKITIMTLFGESEERIVFSFGFVTGWMLLAFYALRFIRMRFDLSAPHQWLIAALVSNFVLFFFFAFAYGWQYLFDWDYWSGFLINLLFSSMLITIAGVWFFDLMLSFYRLLGIDLYSLREGGDE